MLIETNNIHYLWFSVSERTMYFILLVLITLGGVTLRSVIVDVLFVERVTESVCSIVSINNKPIAPKCKNYIPG